MTSRPSLCPACLGRPSADTRDWFGGAHLLTCEQCHTEWVHPQPSDGRLNEIYSADYYEPWTYESSDGLDSMKRRTFEPILDSCGVASGSTLLDVGCATGSLLAVARERDLRTFGLDINEHAVKTARARDTDARIEVGDLEGSPFPGIQFDAIVMVDFIEHVRDPAAELALARSRLAATGRLVISTPCVDSIARRALRGNWPQYREEHLTYFSRDGLRKLLCRLGLEFVDSRVTRKAITLAYAYGQARSYPVPIVTSMTTLAYHLLPFLRHRPVRLPFGEVMVIAAATL
jgi:2-polyprenyl-3-methyl-5-hydroxy-6-metoxy-1,4-benzoquinol methylase